MSVLFSMKRMEEHAKKYWEQRDKSDTFLKENLGMEVLPFDARFPNTNQTTRCWVNYVDYHRCVKHKGDDYELCKYFYKIYNRICFKAWITKWDWYRKKGILPTRIE